MIAKMADYASRIHPMALSGRKPKMPPLRDRRIEFLESHRRSPYTTFNAQYAHSRLHHLTIILEQELPVEKDVRIDDELFFLRPYYLVSICTCLEWHARSRVRDFIEYYADRLDVDDKIIPRDLAAKTIIEGIKQGSTIGELVAVTLRINSTEEYISAMEAGFRLAGCVTDLKLVLDHWRTSTGDELAQFFDLFSLRHAIVHEMPLALFENRRIGPLIYIDQIRSIATVGYSLLQAFEKLILEKLPIDFPDKLTWLDDHSELEPVGLIEEIKRLENLVEHKIDIDDREKFKVLTDAWRKYYEQEESDNNSYIPRFRHSNDREFFLRQLCLDRIRYLRRIIKEYGYSET